MTFKALSLGVAIGALVASAVLWGQAASAQTAAASPAIFGQPERLLGAQAGIASAAGFTPVYAGDEVVATGQGFRPGQAISLLYGRTPLQTGNLRADAEGKFEARLTVPANAAAGTHPIVVVAEAPYNAVIAELKVSPRVPLSGQSGYRVTSVEAARGLYQTAYGARRNAVFATSAVGRPPVRQSELLRLNADTLAVQARVTPAPAQPAAWQPAGAEGGVHAVYGVAVDDAHDTVWVTNTRQDTVAVYRQSDLSLVRQHPAGATAHPRDVVVHEARDKAYVSAVSEPEVVVFDTASLDVARRIPIRSAQWGERFSPGGLALDRESGRLFVAGLSTNEVAIIDTATDTVEKVLPVPGARSVIGVAYDPTTRRIFVAAQGSDNVVILNADDGSVVADTPVGAGALNVVFEPVGRRAYVSSFGAGTVTVLDPDGRIVANLPAAPVANHVSVDGRGAVFAAVKSGWTTDGNDTIQRIQPRR